MGDPTVVLCDEPTGNLDSVTGREIMDILFDINRDEGTSFVIVSHDDHVAERCDRVVRLHDGVVAEIRENSRRDPTAGAIS